MHRFTHKNTTFLWIFLPLWAQSSRQQSLDWNQMANELLWVWAKRNRLTAVVMPHYNHTEKLVTIPFWFESWVIFHLLASPNTNIGFPIRNSIILSDFDNKFYELIRGHDSNSRTIYFASASNRFEIGRFNLWKFAFSSNLIQSWWLEERKKSKKERGRQK